MSFPISKNHPGTLYYNFALKMNEQGPVALQSIELALKLIKELGEMVPLNPGTIGELELCFKRVCSTSREPSQIIDVNSWRQNVITSRVVAHSTFATQSENLTDAVLLLGDKKPPIGRLFPLLKEFVEITGLETPMDQSWQRFTDRIYAEERKTTKDYLQIRDFYALVELEIERKNCARRKHLNVFHLESDRVQIIRLGLQQVLEIAEMNVDLRMQATLKEITQNHSDYLKQIEVLQLVCSVLWAEHQLNEQLDKFSRQLLSILPKKHSNVPTESHITSFESENQNDLQSIIDNLFPYEFRDELLNYVNARFSECGNLKSPKMAIQDAWSASPKSSEILLNLVEELGGKIRVTEVPAHLRQLESQWKELNGAIANSLKHIVARKCVFYTFTDLAHTFDLLFAHNQGDNLMVNTKIAQFFTPSFSLIKDRFLVLWREHLDDSSDTKISLEEQLEGVEIVHRTVQLSSASRIELYRALRDTHHRKLQSLRGKPKITVVLRNNLLSTDGPAPLPYYLDSQISCDARSSDQTPPSSHQPSAQETTSKRTMKRQARAARLMEERNSAPLTPGVSPNTSESAQTALVPRERKPLNLSVWKSTINYAPRVTRWFDAKYRLQREKFPEYFNGDKERQSLMIRLHRHLPMADFFLQRGVELPSQIYWGENVRRIAIPAELTFQSETQKGILLWAFNENNVCYHRFFHRKLDRDSDQYIQTLEQAIEDECASKAESTNFAAHETVQLVFDEKNISNEIEVDELLGTATLRSQQYPGLALKVLFMKF